MTSLEGFQEHLSIISKVVCCGCYLKNNVAFTLIFYCIRMRWMFISSTTIWVTGSDTSSVASRARSQRTSSKCEWNRIWTIYYVDETTPCHRPSQSTQCHLYYYQITSLLTISLLICTLRNDFEGGRNMVLETHIFFRLEKSGSAILDYFFWLETQKKNTSL